MIAPGPAGLQPVGAAAAGPPPKKLSENRPNLLFFSALRGVECRSRIVSKPRLSWPLRPATPAAPRRGPGPAPPPTPPFRGARRGRLGTAAGTWAAPPACRGPVLQPGLAFPVLVGEQPQRGVQPCRRVVPLHLDGDER